MQKIAEVKMIQQKTEVVFVRFKFIDIWGWKRMACTSVQLWNSSVSPSLMLTCLNFWLHAPGSTWNDRCTQGLKQQQVICENQTPNKKSLVNFWKAYIFLSGNNDDPRGFNAALSACERSLQWQAAIQLLEVKNPLEAENHPFKQRKIIWTKPFILYV